jgi:4-hydroxy-3-methylbut-2-enyl diphosphate reductase
MRVILAQPRGFCAGVVRAIETVEHALAHAGQPVYVRHQIVHNQHVVRNLENKGALFVSELDQVPEGATAVFSAHGVSRDVEAAARKRNLAIFDATCPLVTKVHRQGRDYQKQGRQVILIGHAGHPEVEGTIGQMEKEVHLVQTVADVQALQMDVDTPVAYVTQTTLSVDDTRVVIDAIKARFVDVAGPDTRDICYATQNRQSAVRELAKEVDVLLVVGAANSSNSNRLREIGSEAGVPSYLVADGAALSQDWFADCKVIGVTAGASAPEAMVRDVLAVLARFGAGAVETMQGLIETVEFRLPAISHPGPALAAGV